ncbi:MAG: thiamine-phosphate kinase [Deltaproteobacteria bacterium]|nr:thiamine-phosphate kinase [Deltaproteobacteria bacterium]MBW2384448.1 thiamine-phosphate kinase [Deltaproteobacteria bacterium]MBW2695190.1 thiamine-phosphate kinase [Deltaproteobacteria bacterium]
MRTLADLGEFGLIERIVSRAGPGRAPQIVLGIGDDAAVIRPRAGEDMVVSTDAAVEGVHFQLSRQTPRNVGRRALVANLSDLAAMGARPICFTLALAAPPTLPVATFDGVLAGLLVEARRHACPLVGGNVTRARSLHLAITVLGAVKRGRALRRDALRVGDRLFVTGSLGGPAAERLRARRYGTAIRQVPVPRLAAGRALTRLAERGACIDLSDGLAADLGHLLEASGGLGAAVDAARLPLAPAVWRLRSQLRMDPLVLAVSGGEDYELLFSLRARRQKRLDEPTLSQRLGVVVTEIGSVTRTPGVRGLPDAIGWRHF